MDDLAVDLVGPEVGTADGGPGAHSALVEPGLRERRQAPFGCLERHLVAQRVPEKGGNIVYGLMVFMAWLDGFIAVQSYQTDMHRAIVFGAAALGFALMAIVDAIRDR